MNYDSKIVIESKDILEKCRNIQAKILLLGGQKSQRYLKSALEELSKILPGSERVELPIIGHLAAENDGKPELVANELKLFFKDL